jgi:hypothetical protein
MRGFPLLNLLLALLLSGAALLPLVRRATHTVQPDAGTAPVAELPADGPRSVNSYVSLEFVDTPQSVRLASGGKVLREWPSAPNSAPLKNLLEDNVPLPLDEYCAELDVQVQWPAGTRKTNVELRLEPDGLPARKATVWSSGGRAEELITLSWKEDAP